MCSKLTDVMSFIKNNNSVFWQISWNHVSNFRVQKIIVTIHNYIGMHNLQIIKKPELVPNIWQGNKGSSFSFSRRLWDRSGRNKVAMEIQTIL